MGKLTIHNQEYWDRLQCAESWVQRAAKIQEWDDFHGPFIFYWIALNSLYGRHVDSQRWDEEDLNWLLQRICEMDREEGALLDTVKACKRKADRLLKDQFLLKCYWEEGLSVRAKRILNDDFLKPRRHSKEERLRDTYEFFSGVCEYCRIKFFMAVQPIATV